MQQLAVGHEFQRLKCSLSHLRKDLSRSCSETFSIKLIHPILHIAVYNFAQCPLSPAMLDSHVLQEANRNKLSVFRIFATGGDASGYIFQTGPGGHSRAAGLQAVTLALHDVRWRLVSPCVATSVTVMTGGCHAINVFLCSACCMQHWRCSPLAHMMSSRARSLLQEYTTRRFGGPLTTCLPRLPTTTSK